jgi:c(7)-type cytochrome triheme protein
MKRYLPLVLLLLLAATQAFPSGEKVKRPKPSEFGNVVIDNYSTKKGEAAVVFPHWLHRSKYTCRLCHVDLGFAMQAGGTDITEMDNTSGLFCGSCHNNKTAFGPTVVDNLGLGKREQCKRCHSLGEQVEMQNSFRQFRQEMPRERFGNGIDWMTAEDQGKIKLVDFLEGISFKRNELKKQEDFQISASEQKMPKIIFSHKKHAVWNGCETCHPEIFPVKKGSDPYSMQQIFAGKYCGACHDKVAFPNIDCQRCHTDSVY